MPQSKSKRILIAEDEKAYSRPLSLKLKSEGFEVDVAGDGKEALSYLKKNKYNLLLLDLIMPNKGGFEVMEELQKKKIKVKIIVLTNLSQEEDKKKAEDMGVVDFVNKADTQISEVLEKVKKQASSKK